MTESETRIERELLRGAAPLAVLSVLARGEMYAYELMKALSLRSAGLLSLGQSTLYPLLYTLEAQGLIESREGEGPNGRRRRYYRLTRAGGQRLADGGEQWQRLAQAMSHLGVGAARD